MKLPPNFKLDEPTMDDKIETVLNVYQRERESNDLVDAVDSLNRVDRNPWDYVKENALTLYSHSPIEMRANVRRFVGRLHYLSFNGRTKRESISTLMIKYAVSLNLESSLTLDNSITTTL